MNNILISVVIPFKINDLIYFDQLIDCLSSYSNSCCEFIFVDDYSNENLSKLAETKVKRINNSIFLRNKENLGVSNSRNRGIEVSNGEYIMFVDSDDLIDIRILNDLPAIIKKMSCNSLLCLKMEYFDNSPDFSSNYHSPIVSKTTQANDAIQNYLYFNEYYNPFMFKSACGKLFCKKILADNNLRFNISLKHYEDSLFVSEYSFFVNSVVLLDNQTFYFYRRNSISASNKFDDTLIWQINNYYDLYKEKCPSLYNTLVLDTIYLFIPYLIKNHFIGKKRVKFKDVNSILKVPYISEAIFNFKKIKLYGCKSRYLIRLQKLLKNTPRLIWARYIYFITKKYLMS